MLVRITKAYFDPQQRAASEQIEDEIARFYLPEQGCIFSRFFCEPETGMYGNISVWENQERMQAALAPEKLAPILARAKPLLLKPTVTEIYPVYEPK